MAIIEQKQVKNSIIIKDTSRKIGYSDITKGSVIIVLDKIRNETLICIVKSVTKLVKIATDVNENVALDCFNIDRLEDISFSTYECTYEITDILIGEYRLELQGTFTSFNK